MMNIDCMVNNMTGNVFGEQLKIMTWGESHGPALGVVIDGCPSGLCIDEADIQKELDRRKPGQNKIVSQRKEDDKVEILSGVFEGKTTGTPISLIVWNKDADSSKYEKIKDFFRPGHADFSFLKKFGIRDHKGGGRSSGRETVSRVCGGGVAKKIIDKAGIKIYAYAKQIGDVICDKIDLDEIENNNVRCADKGAAQKMEKLILDVKKQRDSIGGIVEILVKRCPVGLGDPVFDKLEADLAKALMSIGAVKGVEFGKGFGVAELRGSENNDEMDADGFKSNRSGGVLGGISTGEDIVIRIAVKPTPSISKEQKTIDVDGNEVGIKIEGRHDPCIVPRLIPVAENMVALVLADKILIQEKNEKGKSSD